MKAFVATVILMHCCHGASAAWPYAVEQLHQMVAAGDYPPQGYMLDWEKRDIPLDVYRKSPDKTLPPFDACKLAAEEVVEPFRGQFQVATIIDTNWSYLVKAWTTEGITVANCSHADFSFIVTRYEYRK